MASINEIADALGSVIKAATGLECSGLVDDPHPPCVMIYPDSIGGDTYFQAFKRGVVTVPMICNVLVESSVIEGDQRFLNDIVSPFGQRSIPEAIHRNPTLGTAADEATSAGDMSAVVTGMSDYTWTENPSTGVRLLQAKVRVDVMTRGDR